MFTSSRDQPVAIRHYRRQFRRAAAMLPADQRRDLIAQIDAHLDDITSRTSSADQLAAELELLGDPNEIVAEAQPTARPPRTWIDLVALLSLSIGSIVIPIIGWLVGVALLWRSSILTPHQKVLGTAVWPGGWALPFFVMMWFGGDGAGSAAAGTELVQLAPVIVLAVSSVAVTGYLFAAVLRSRTR